MKRPWDRRRVFRDLGALLTALFLAGCAAPPSERGHKKILVLGDSLTEGNGLEASKVYPALLEKLIREKGFPEVMVVADGVSGATSETGLPRLSARLDSGEKYDILLLALGGNDGLRGLSLQALRENLKATIRKAKTAGCQVLLAGMRMPPHHGLSYMSDYKALFPELAREEGARLIPFLLKDVAAKPGMNQDGIHPNEKGQEAVARTVFEYLEPML